jgi:hypothetical protein
MNIRCIADLVDGLLSSGWVYRIRSACARFAREPEVGRIALVLAIGVLAVVIAIWTHRPTRAEENSIVRTKPMVTPQQMQGVFIEAERGRRRR